MFWRLHDASCNYFKKDVLGKSLSSAGKNITPRISTAATLSVQFAEGNYSDMAFDYVKEKLPEKFNDLIDKKIAPGHRPEDIDFLKKANEYTWKLYSEAADKIIRKQKEKYRSTNEMTQDDF